MVAKKAGQFAGGFFNNPGVVAIFGILIAVAIPLITFRKQISDFLSQGLPDITLPTINLPSFELPSFELPSFELPSFELPSFELPDFSNLTEQLEEIAGNVLNPQGAPTTESEGVPIDFTESGMAAARGARGGTDEILEEMVEQQVIPPQVQTTLETGQQFFGGGPSFIGGFVTETPLEFLSLSQIIDMGLASSASEAASLRAQDIGFTEEEKAFLMQGEVDVGGFIAGGPPQVSEERFEGLSATEIALRLTGGPIGNF